MSFVIYLYYFTGIILCLYNQYYYLFILLLIHIVISIIIFNKYLRY